MGSAIAAIIAALAAMFGGRSGDANTSGLDPTQQATANEVLQTQLGRMQVQNPLYEQATHLASALLPRSAMPSAYALTQRPSFSGPNTGFVPGSNGSEPPASGGSGRGGAGRPGGGIPNALMTTPSGGGVSTPSPVLSMSAPSGGGGLGLGRPSGGGEGSPVPRDAVTQLVQMLASGIAPRQQASLFRMPPRA